MANSRSARKQIRASERKHVRNRAVRAAVRTSVGKARRALLAGAEGVDSEDQVKMAVRALDRAAEKGILHPNNARRRKSRLAVMASRLARAEGEAVDTAAVRSAAAGGAKGRGSRAGVTRKAASKPATSKGVAKPTARGAAAPRGKAATRSSRPARGE